LFFVVLLLFFVCFLCYRPVEWFVLLVILSK
jgi:hypothetical protein